MLLIMELPIKISVKGVILYWADPGSLTAIDRWLSPVEECLTEVKYYIEYKGSYLPLS